MKNLIYIVTLLFSATIFAQTNIEDVKEETQVKTIKINDGESITEKKIKITTRETSPIALAEEDENKVNQERVNSISKVKKTIMVDNDKDNDYELLKEETFYKVGDKKYLFKPNKKGFDITYNNKNSKYIKTSSAYNSKNGNYLINDKKYAGIGYFNNNGDFVIEYYDRNKDEIVTQLYIISDTAL